MNTNTEDLTKTKNNNNNSGINFLDTQTEVKRENKDIENLDTDDLKKFLFQLKAEIEGDNSYIEWLNEAKSIESCYFDTVNDQLANAFAADMGSDLDIIFTRGMANKVREMVRVLTNILLKERPMFEPDPSNGDTELSEEDLVIATRYLEHIWDRGGLRTALSVNVKSALRSNRGIMKTSWSSKKKDIIFENVEADNFWFDIDGQPEDSWWYCERREIKYYELELSGLFTPSQLKKIRKQLNIKENEKTGNFSETSIELDKNQKINVYDFYVKQLVDGEEIYMLYTFLEERVFIRKTELAIDGLPYTFLIPEREDNINRPHALADVANASMSSSFMNYKVLNWIKGITDVTVITDQAVQIDRTTTPGVRNITTNSTGGGMTMAPVIANQQMISQDVFFYLDKMERTSENNYGVHPNILQGVNGSAPSNGIVAQTLLANDIHNTSALSQEFGEFLSRIAYKVLHIASQTINQHKTIRIEAIRGDSNSVQVIGANSVPEEQEQSIEEAGIQKIHKFPSIKVTVIPSSAYTDTAKQDKLIQLLQVVPDIIQYIPKSKILETFASGSANLMMHQASREAMQAEKEQMNPEIALAEAENKSISSGQQRIPQQNENHAVHDRVHLIEEQFLLDQAKQANNKEESNQFNQKLGLIRAHRQQHSEMSQAGRQDSNQQAGQSPSVIGSDAAVAEEQGVEGMLTAGAA